jgi:hypothetical protein
LIVISIGGALVVGTGLFYTARNYRLAHRGQVTERFTKALERLGAEELYIRVGGIHALQHVMRDSPDHHGDVVEVLVSYLRDRVMRQSDSDEYEAQFPGGHDPDKSFEPKPDVIAAVQALANRPRRMHRERGDVDLENLMLGAVSMVDGDLRGMDLQRAYLAFADLSGVQFRDGELMHANLRNAILEGAGLRQADLQAVNLADAHLEGAGLRDANVQAEQLLHAVLNRDTKLSNELREELAERRREPDEPQQAS